MLIAAQTIIKGLRASASKMFDWIKVEEDNCFYKFTLPKRDLNQTLYGLAAAHYNIDFICRNYPAPYTLCISGGVDSQAMLYAWYTSGKPYNTMSVKYNTDMNRHDLETLEEFSQIHNISINYVDFDLLNFYQTEYLDYVNKYKCGSPHFCTYMKFSEIITNGTVIFSGTAPNPNFTKLFGVNELGLYRYAKISGRSVVPFFFLETKEMAYSFIEPIHLSEETRGHISRNKIERYLQNGYPVISQKVKITGFEKIKDYYDIHFSDQVTAQDRLYRGFNGSQRVYDLLLRNKYERKYPDKYSYRYCI